MHVHPKLWSAGIGGEEGGGNESCKQGDVAILDVYAAYSRRRDEISSTFGTEPSSLLRSLPLSLVLFSYKKKEKYRSWSLIGSETGASRMNSRSGWSEIKVALKSELVIDRWR